MKTFLSLVACLSLVLASHGADTLLKNAKFQGPVNANGNSILNVAGIYDTNGDPITSGPGGGEVNTGANVGTGVGVFSGKSGVALQFNKLAASGGATVVSNSNIITISADAAGAAATVQTFASAASNSVLLQSTNFAKGITNNNNLGTGWVFLSTNNFNSNALFSVRVGAPLTSDHGTFFGQSANALPGVGAAGTAFGYHADGGDGGAAFGEFADGSGDGAAVGQNADANTHGAAVGESANGSDGGSAVGEMSDGAGGAAIGSFSLGATGGFAGGQNAIGTNYGVGVGQNSDGHGFGNVAIGSYDPNDLNANFLSAKIPEGWTYTVELGAGTAVLQGGLNFRGLGLFDTNGYIVSARLGTNSGSDGWVLTKSGTQTKWIAASGSGTVTSVDVTKQGHTSSGAVTGSGTITLTRTGDENFLQLAATNISRISVSNNASIGGTTLGGGLIVTNGFTNQALTASTLLQSDANKKLASIANGAGVLTNDASGNFGYAPLLNATALKASQFGATDGTTNLVSTQNGYAWTNLNTFDAPTNVFSGNTFWLGTNTLISTASAVNISAIGNIPATGIERYGQLTIIATADLTFTNPAPCFTSDMVDTRTITNGNTAVIAVDVIAGVITNVAIVQFR